MPESPVFGLASDLDRSDKLTDVLILNSKILMAKTLITACVVIVKIVAESMKRK